MKFQEMLLQGLLQHSITNNLILSWTELDKFMQWRKNVFLRLNILNNPLKKISENIKKVLSKKLKIFRKNNLKEQLIPYLMF